jgi:glycosyltransferase involved in cell wall biosynthesis
MPSRAPYQTKNVTMKNHTTYPLVSVLVPAYNAELYLRESIESILAQTYQNIEIIVVDDGSTDGTSLVARSFKTRGVHVIAQHNMGQSAALNAAYHASHGDYLQYLDADDVLHPNKIEIQLARLQRAHPKAMASGAWARFRRCVSDAAFLPEAVWRDLNPVEWLVKSWGGGGMMHVAAWLVPRQVAERAGPWDVSLRWAANIDADFFTRAILTSSCCIFCSEAKSYYRAVPGSQSTLACRRTQEGNFRVILKTGEALLSREHSIRTRRAFADNLQRFVYGTYPDSSDLVKAAEAKIVDLGGSELPASLGSATFALSRIVGWKAAKRARHCSTILLRR